VGELTFTHLQQLDGFYEINERDICYWTQWLHHLLKFHIEPTCAMTMEAVKRWAAKAPSNSRALVILSGGNISQASMAKLWQHDYLIQLPSTD
jgi:threonine dehydratase